MLAALYRRILFVCKNAGFGRKILAHGRFEFVAKQKSRQKLKFRSSLFKGLARLSQKQDNGKISPLTVLPLADYTDLVQFVGVSSSSQNVSAAKEFVNFLLGDDVQKTLSAVGLFSATKIPLYSDGLYAQAEKAWENAYVPNAFADQNTIDAQRKTATSTLQVFGKKRKSDVAELCFSR